MRSFIDSYARAFSWTVWIFSIVGFTVFADIPTTSRSVRQAYEPDQPTVYAPSRITSNDFGSPVLLELHRDLVSSNGPDGLYGICAKVYRVLQDARLPPAEECRRYHNSRQAGFGDITEFYYTLVESKQFNKSLEFPIADRLGQVSFQASFLYLHTKGNEPVVLLEASPTVHQVVCVESVKCPPKSTSALPVISSSPNPTSSSLVDQANEIVRPGKRDNSKEDTIGTVRSVPTLESDAPSSQFWDTLLSGTEIRSWFLATVSLSSICLLLLILLVITWIYVCRIRRVYQRRRCHGTCRFGCRCPPDVVRQTSNSAAVYGPLDSQNTQLYQASITPHGNGSVRSGSGFGPTLFSGGTMTSSRWGSNGGHKLGSPLYVSPVNIQEKSSLLTPISNCFVQPTANPPSDSAWNQQYGQRASSHVQRRRVSQDICRSTSEGSSVSGHPPPNGVSKPIVPGHGRSTLTAGFGVNNQGNNNNNAATTVLPSMLITSVSVPQSGPVAGPVYYHANGLSYNQYTDEASIGSMSPGLDQSSTQLAERNSADRNYYNASHRLNGSTGLTIDGDHGGHHTTTFFPSSSMASKNPGSSDPVEACSTFNSYGNGSLRPENSYQIRESEGDLLNITPPSGFYDFNSSVVDSAMASGSLTSSTGKSAYPNGPNGFPSHPFLPPLYHALEGLRGPGEWVGRPRTSLPVSSTAEMVGMVDVDVASRIPSSGISRTNTSDINTFKPTDVCVSPKVGTVHLPIKQMLSPGVYTASERML